tara:strand:- start:103 stop:633 length:531 start_codon:yes stop_codon:yes gene_type:complete
MQELLKTTDNPNCSLEDLIPAISKHHTAVATTLQVANTAFLGAGGHVDTIEQAIQMLRMDYVRNLAITELAKKQLELSPGMQEIANGVLKHCVETSQCGSQMRQFGVSAKQAQSLSSITLLHDLGKLVLLANKDEDYVDLSKTIVRYGTWNKQSTNAITHRLGRFSSRCGDCRKTL